jgi:hypothetical protein
MKVYTKPQSTDILGGGGSKVFKHAGNKWLKKNIVELLESYNSTDSQERCYIIRNIIGKNDQQWYDAVDSTMPTSKFAVLFVMLLSPTRSNVLRP